MRALTIPRVVPSELTCMGTYMLHITSCNDVDTQKHKFGHLAVILENTHESLIQTLRVTTGFIAPVKTL